MTFLKTIQEPEIAAQRVSVVDVMCEDENGVRFIIEMQLARSTGFFKRAQLYAAKAYIEQREAKVEYKDLKEVVFVAIADTELFPHKSAVISHHLTLDKETLERDLDGFSFTFIDLYKFHKTADQLETMTDKWLYFLKNAESSDPIEFEHNIENAPLVAKAYKQLDQFNWTPEELRGYDSLDKEREAYFGSIEYAAIEGEKRGKIEGKFEEKVAIALNLIKMGLDNEAIAKATGLSISDIASLRR